jgi:hypothetical protein
MVMVIKLKQSKSPQQQNLESRWRYSLSTTHARVEKFYQESIVVLDKWLVTKIKGKTDNLVLEKWQVH